jgi:hypothetical protein
MPIKAQDNKTQHRPPASNETVPAIPAPPDLAPAATADGVAKDTPRPRVKGRLSLFSPRRP